MHLRLLTIVSFKFYCEKVILYLLTFRVGYEMPSENYYKTS